MPENEPIRCMQLPLTGFQLLVPNSSVAEIFSFSMPEQAGAKVWELGNTPWRGASVPVITLEKMCDQKIAEYGARTRIAILYNPSEGENLPYLGLVLQDIPRAYLAEEERIISASEPVECEYLECLADAQVEKLFIPNIQAIFQALST